MLAGNLMKLMILFSASVYSSILAHWTAWSYRTINLVRVSTKVQTKSFSL